MKTRNTDIDRLKGVAIILVVMGHAMTTNNIFQVWLYSFHLPAFFLCTGIILSETKSEWNFERAKEKSYKLIRHILPVYLLFSASLQLLMVVSDYILKRNHTVEDYILSYLKKLVIGYGVGPEWFLIALLIGEILFITGISLRDTRYKIGFFIFIGLLFLGVLIVHHQYTNPIYIVLARGIVGWFFISCGYFVREYTKGKKNTKTIHCIIWGLAIISVPLSIINTRVDMSGLWFKEPSIYIYNALFGTALSLLVVRKIDWFRHLEFWGKNSLVVLGTHYFPILVLQNIFEKIIRNKIIATICVIVAVLIAEYILLRFYNYMKGRKK